MLLLGTLEEFGGRNGVKIFLDTSQKIVVGGKKRELNKIDSNKKDGKLEINVSHEQYSGYSGKSSRLGVSRSSCHITQVASESHWLSLDLSFYHE